MVDRARFSFRRLKDPSRISRALYTFRCLMRFLHIRCVSREKDSKHFHVGSPVVVATMHLTKRIRIITLLKSSSRYTTQLHICKPPHASVQTTREGEGAPPTPPHHTHTLYLLPTHATLRIDEDRLHTQRSASRAAQTLWKNYQRVDEEQHAPQLNFPLDKPFGLYYNGI